MESVHLSDRAVIALEGPEARDFLQGLMTNDLTSLEPGRGIYAALLTPQGKILFDFLIAEGDGALLLDCAMASAEALVKNLGICHEVLPIEPVFQSVEKQLEKVFAKLKTNEAEENLQSRLRGVTLMALSNKFGALVLTTGNKSELAVGYCTLYGDMNGALAPLADVLKTDIYKIARWVNREKIIIPENSISKPPSAELRPNQTDQDSLPPYETLDAILDLYVVKNLSKNKIILKGFDAAIVNDVLNKINFSEYKRRQAAPGLKISPRAFGIGRRIPIAQKFRAGN